MQNEVKIAERNMECVGGCDGTVGVQSSFGGVIRIPEVRVLQAAGHSYVWPIPVLPSFRITYRLFSLCH